MYIDKEIIRLEMLSLQKRAKRNNKIRTIRKVCKYALSNSRLLLKAFSSFKDKRLLASLQAGGGLGDILRANALLCAFAEKYPDIFFDVYINKVDLGKFLFGALPNVRCIYYEHLFPLFAKKYAFNISTLQIAEVKINKKDLLPQELTENFAKAAYIRELYAKHGEHAYHYILRRAVENKQNFMDILGLTAGIENLRDFKPKLNFNKNNPFEGRKYITFANSSNKNDGVGVGATKCWPVEYWTELIALIKKEYPDLEIIQLGESNSVKIPLADTSLVATTSLEEMSCVLSGSLLHLDCDCGLVHFARALGVKCLVLFGPTSAEYVGYDGNINLKAPFCGNCWHIKRSWYKKCPLGFGGAKCMQSLSSEIVFKAFKENFTF